MIWQFKCQNKTCHALIAALKSDLASRLAAMVSDGVTIKVSCRLVSVQSSYWVRSSHPLARLAKRVFQPRRRAKSLQDSTGV